MRDDPITHLRKVREEGVKILVALIEATPETVATVCAQEDAWKLRIVEAAEPFGANEAALFEPLGTIRLEETASMHGLRYLSYEHFDSLRCHSARMFRLNELFRKLPAPKAKSGRKPIDDDEIVDKAHQIMATQKKQNKKAALEKALYDMDPPLAPEEYERAFDRIYKNKL